jgi:hypothetical protein
VSLIARYYDLATSASSGFYYDRPIQITLRSPYPVNISNSDINNCYQNPFGVSLGANCGPNCWTVAAGIYANPSDENLLISGYTHPAAPFMKIDDATDGFVVRMSSTGYVEWLSSMAFQ